MENIEALCITLKPQSKSTIESIQKIKKLGFKKIKIIKAVEGVKLSKDELKKILSVRDFYELEKGRYVHEAFSGKESVGCFLSHLECWKECLEKGKEIAIFEDDFNINEEINFNEIINNSYNEFVKNNYDILRITPIKTNHYIQTEEKKLDFLYKINREHCLSGYILTPKAAEYLVKYHQPISCQADHYINFICHNYDLKQYGITKNIFKDGIRPTTLKHNNLLKYDIDCSTESSNTTLWWVFFIFLIIIIILVVILEYNIDIKK